MTTVYGVTFVGAREQLEKRLEERGDVPVEDAWLASSYLAKRVRIEWVLDPFYFIAEMMLFRFSPASVICSAAPKASRPG